MKTIKIKYVGFWDDIHSADGFFLHDYLKNFYDVQITDDPDYIICSCFDGYHYLKYPQIRILFSGENVVPDLNLVDYGISVYPMEMLDRHFSFPGMVGSLKVFEELRIKDRNYPDEIMTQKTLFANSIFSHESDNGMRTKLFNILNGYRRVESPGPLNYNMPNGEKVKRADGSKEALQRKTKFTLCCESTCQPGFITEKIFEAFASDTIPIYYGSSNISDIVNKEAFINLADYESLEAVLDVITHLDKDDEAYLRMLRQPIFNDPQYLEKKFDEMEAFFRHIFDQPLEQAYRRPFSYLGAQTEKDLKSWDEMVYKRNWFQRLCGNIETFLRFFYRGRGIVTKLKSFWR